MTELKDWLNSINQTKKHLIDEDPSIEKEYPPYIVNRCFSGHIDTLMFANEMNQYHFLPKKMQHDFLINIVRKKKRTHVSKVYTSSCIFFLYVSLQVWLALYETFCRTSADMCTTVTLLSQLSNQHHR